MKILNTRDSSIPQILAMLRQKRSGADSQSIRQTVRKILDSVKQKGDTALFEWTQSLDGIQLKSLKVTPQEISAAAKAIPAGLLNALKHAKRNIEKFHRQTIRPKEKTIETEPGVAVWREFRPIERVGLYAPGGKAAYPSTVLMLGIPARLAGCETVVLCTPAGKDGRCNPALLAAANLCGIREIYKIGGAQAIAAMAYGTETIPKVYKIFGPGNPYVTNAKMQVFGEVDIDMPAGPSEVLVIADDSAKPSWVAADLLSQLEHGEDSQAVLITFSNAIAEAVLSEMKSQMQGLSRKAILQQSFGKSFALIVKSVDEACELANAYAPEHLEIVAKGDAKIAKRIKNAGSIFLGGYTNEPLGDYATGANHTLATSGYAKMFSSLSAESFGKMIQIQKVTRKGLQRLKETVERLAATEGLDAHRNAVTVRFR